LRHRIRCLHTSKERRKVAKRCVVKSRRSPCTKKQMYELHWCLQNFGWVYHTVPKCRVRRALCDYINKLHSKRSRGREKCSGRLHVRIRTSTSGSGRGRPDGRQNTSTGRRPDVNPKFGLCALLLPTRPQMKFGTNHSFYV
jgi:hypothetical protein